MTQAPSSEPALSRGWEHSWPAWLVRDVLLLSTFVWIFRSLGAWHQAGASLISGSVLAAASFVFAYAACYVVHEWGHDLGARLLGARFPRGSIRGVLLAQFDPTRHTREQFLGLGFGGMLAYLATAALVLSAWQPELGHRAAAAGVLAFITQSVWVDFGVLGPVLRGEPILDAMRTGLTGDVIGRKTLIAWTGLAAVLLTLRALGYSPV